MARHDERTPNEMRIEMITQPIVVRSSLIFLYVASWIGFGFTYRWLADASNGAAFIFNEDVRLFGQMRAFKRAVGSSVDQEVIFSLLKADGGNRFGVRIQTDGVADQVYSDQPLGYDWAAFYSSHFEREGATHFETKVLDRSPPPLANLAAHVEGMPRLPETEFYKIALRLVRAEPYVLPTPERPFKSMAAVATYIIWTDRPPQQLRIEGHIILALPLSFLPHLLERSYNFPDDSLFKLQSVVRGHFRYPLADFMYFSAVTITTVGYGDILPGNTTTRMVVMAEAMLGVILIGAFVSSLFWRPDRSSSK